MKDYTMKQSSHLSLLEGESGMKQQPAKRINIVSLKLVKESSILYKQRRGTRGQVPRPISRKALWKEISTELFFFARNRRDRGKGPLSHSLPELKSNSFFSKAGVGEERLSIMSKS
jgi:hypothetical protein